MNQRFYKLSHDFERFKPHGEEGFGDGYLETKFNNWKEMGSAFYTPMKIDLIGEECVVTREQQADKLWYIAKAQMPENPTFMGFDDLFHYTDYPYFSGTEFWPIISKKMLTTLLSARDFSHQVIPVFIKHVDTFSHTEEGNTPSIHNYDFVILQLLEHLDCLDRDNSEYTSTPYKSNPSINRLTIHKMVLKEPKNGFPPIFRVKESEISLYVSAEAKEALEKAGIQGLDFSSCDIESS
jgi:hypothetical protein